MKKISILIMLFNFFFSFSQSQGKLQFSYDAAGNQTLRHYIVVNNKMASKPKAIKNLTNTDLSTSDIYDDIKYYPNPVLEELYVKWTNNDILFVNSIQLYDMSGRQLKTYDNLKNEDNNVIQFQEYPIGYYNLVLYYSNGEKKTLKIVKK